MEEENMKGHPSLKEEEVLELMAIRKGGFL